MPILVAILLTVLASWAMASLLPANDAWRRTQAFETQARLDMDAIEGAMRRWFVMRMDSRFRASLDPSQFILPAGTATFDRMLDAFAFRQVNRGDPNGEPYFLKYVNGNSFAPVATPVGTVNIVPLDRDAQGGFVRVPVAIIATPGPNRRWDVPTQRNAAGLNVPSDAAITYIVNGMSATGLPIPTGDDIFRVVRFTAEVRNAIVRSQVALRNAAAGLSVYFNYQSATTPGFYPATLDDFALWTGGVIGLRNSGVPPSKASPITVDGFGYPLYYYPTGLYLDPPTNKKPMQVGLDVPWFAKYGLN